MTVIIMADLNGANLTDYLKEHFPEEYKALEPGFDIEAQKGVDFNSHDSYISFLGSKLILVESCKYSYVDLNTNRRLPKRKFKSLTQEEIAMMKNRMRPYF